MSDHQKNNKPKKEETEEEFLTEEDIKLKEDLELIIQTIKDSDEGVQGNAIDTLIKEIKSATSSMTSVPKPLKFLRPHYEELKGIVLSLQGDNKAKLSNVVSWLAMTSSDPELREGLRFILLGSSDAIEMWGHDYIRHLSTEVGLEYEVRTENNQSVDELLNLVDVMVPFMVTHNAEPDACDLLIQIEKLEKIIDVCNEHNFQRIATYLESCASYLPEPEDFETLKVCMKIYNKMEKTLDTLRLALRVNDEEQISQLYTTCEFPIIKSQMALMLGQHGYFKYAVGDEPIEEDDDLQELIGNARRNDFFQLLVKGLDLEEPIDPVKDVYKEHISGKSTQKADSARLNLATTFVNAFANAGFNTDTYMIQGESDWLFKNKDHAKISAAASVGLICIWSHDSGPNEVDKYGYIEDKYVKAGIRLALGILNANVRTSFNIAWNIIQEQFGEYDNEPIVKQCTALALGIAYGGCPDEEAAAHLMELYDDGYPTMEVLAHVALSLGLMYVGTADPELTQLFSSSILTRGLSEELDSTYSRYLCLALGLLYLGKQEACEVASAALSVIPGTMGKYAQLTLETCAYAGSGNVLQIQKLLAVCGEHLEEDESLHQGVAVLGISLIAMSEEIGSQMVLRSFDHLLQYGELSVQRAVPLALGLLHVSNPDISVTDILIKLSHNNDDEISMGAIFALGLIGAGTNNARIAQLLRGLASYYNNEPTHVFIIRIAQAMLYLGKGTMTLSPYHAHNSLLKPSSLAGLLVTLHTCLDIKGLILKEAHYFLYSIAMSLTPRMLITFDPEMNPVPVQVRVGKAVDVAGKPGNPKTITGFQQHTTPVLLGHGERAELASDDFIAYTPILEGSVIVTPNEESTSQLKKRARLKRSQRRLLRRSKK